MLKFAEFLGGFFSYLIAFHILFLLFVAVFVCISVIVTYFEYLLYYRNMDQFNDYSFKDFIKERFIF